jgi:hypothetical protein
MAPKGNKPKTTSKGEKRMAKAMEMRMSSPSKTLPRTCNQKKGEGSSDTPVPQRKTPPPKPKGGKGPLIRKTLDSAPPPEAEKATAPAPEAEKATAPAPEAEPAGDATEPGPAPQSPDLGSNLEKASSKTDGYSSTASSTTNRRNARRGCSSRPSSPTDEAELVVPPFPKRPPSQSTVLQTSSSAPPVDAAALVKALTASASLPAPKSVMADDHVEDMVQDDDDVRGKDDDIDSDDSGDAESASDPQFRPEEDEVSGNSDGSEHEIPKLKQHINHKKRKAGNKTSIPIVKKPRTPQTPRTSISKKKLTSKSPAYVPKGPLDEARDAGEKALLLAHVRKAFSDIGPSVPPQPPFIYWDPDVTFACAAKLINRYTQLIELSRSNPYERKNDMAKKWGQTVRTQANNERSTQIRTIKSLWLNNASQLSLTKYDANPRTPEVELADVLLEQTELETVDDLRDLLFSDQMYKNETVFDMFCLGIESGGFKHTEECPPTPISDLLTPSHEAHFRAELWWTLPHAQFRHGIGLTHAAKRIKKWHEFLPLVRADRLNNEVAAVINRTQMYAQHGVAADADPDEGAGLDVADTMYWN